MKIYITLATVSGNLEHPAAVIKIDTIKHDGKMWLVPEWIDGPTEGLTIAGANSLFGHAAASGDARE